MRKIIIWGAGSRGKHIVDAVGADKVQAIVERNNDVVGSYYRGVPIVSFKSYLNQYRDFPVFVTPRGHEGVITAELENQGIDWAFTYEQEGNSVIGLFQQYGRERLRERLCNGMEYAIWGYNLLAILLYDFLEENGIECRLIENPDVAGSIKSYFKDVLKMKEETQEECGRKKHTILLAEPMEEAKRENFGDNAIEQYYDFGLRRDCFYNPLLEKFRGIHHGKRCFIVATGPSLRMEDLDKLYQNRELTISVNGIFAAFDKTEWRPDYYIVSDKNVTRIRKSELLSSDISGKFVADMAWEFAAEEEQPNLYQWHLIRQWSNGEMPEFSEDFSRGNFTGYTVTYDGALQLAVYMGFTEIYLLGTDCSKSDGVKTRHFSTDYYTPEEKNANYSLQLDKILLSYQAAKKYADAHGIKIYNATRGGELEVFERVDFDSLFEEKEVNTDEH